MQMFVSAILLVVISVGIHLALISFTDFVLSIMDESLLFLKVSGAISRIYDGLQVVEERVLR